MATEEETKTKKLIKDWVAKNKTLRILIFGKTGVGKSSLINTLLGKAVAEEGEDIFSVTRNISSYDDVIPELTRTINGIQVTLWDTPGLQDPDIEAEKILEEVKGKCKGQVDLFVYCHDMTETRASQDDYDAISELTNALGREIWMTSIIVLTFANRVRLPPSSDLRFKDYFEDRRKQWQQTLSKAVHKAGVPIEDASKIPVVPASYKKIPLSHQDRDWFVTFWDTCILRVKFGSLPALIGMYQNEALNDVTKRAVDYRVTAMVIAKRLRWIGERINNDLDVDLQELMINAQGESISRMLFAEARRAASSNIITRIKTLLRIYIVWLHPILFSRSVVLGALGGAGLVITG